MVTGSPGPAWLSVLLAAEAWGCPPWVIADGDGEKLTWLIRWLKYREARAEAEELKNG